LRRRDLSNRHLNALEVVHPDERAERRSMSVAPIDARTAASAMPVAAKSSIAVRLDGPSDPCSPVASSDAPVRRG